MSLHPHTDTARTTTEPRQPHPPSPAIRAAVRTAEDICALPCIATQDWCDRAAGALLHIHPPCIVLMLIARFDGRGTLVTTECSGAAGCTVAQVGTTVGRRHATPSIVAMDPTAPPVSTMRTAAMTLTASSNGTGRGESSNDSPLGWSPTDLPPADARAGRFEAFAPGRDWRTGPTGNRWVGAEAADLLVGALHLGHQGGYDRVLIIEIGLTEPDARATPDDDAVLEAVLPTLASRAAKAVQFSAKGEIQWLTRREEQVLAHLLRGESVREIAAALGRSQHTVHDHVKSLHRKFNASSRGELVAKALGHLALTGADQNGSSPPAGPAETEQEPAANPA